MSNQAVKLLADGNHPAFMPGIEEEVDEQPEGTDDQDLMEVYLGQIGIPFLRETLSLIGFHRE